MAGRKRRKTDLSFDEKISNQNATEAVMLFMQLYWLLLSYRQDYLDQCHKGQQVHEDRAGSAEL